MQTIDWHTKIITELYDKNRPLYIIAVPWLILIGLLTSSKEDLKIQFSNLTNEQKENIWATQQHHK